MHESIPKNTLDIPWTIGWVVRKLMQLESFAELPKEKRPPDNIIWDGTPEELDEWFDKVFGKKKAKQDEFVFQIDESEIE